MLIGAPIPILVLASLVTETPVGELFGKNVCWIFTFLASCCVTKIGVSGFFLAIYRIICLKRPLQGMKKLRQISNELIVLEWITMFLIQGIHISGIGFTGTDMTLAFCRYFTYSHRDVVRFSKPGGHRDLYNAKIQKPCQIQNSKWRNSAKAEKWHLF